MENTIKAYKQTSSLEEYNIRIENLSNSLGKLISSYSSPFAQSLFKNLCNTAMSLAAVFCKSELMRAEVFECSNPAITDYLREQQITRKIKSNIDIGQYS
jgi:hypothetical protein